MWRSEDRKSFGLKLVKSNLMSGEKLLHQRIPFMLECPVGGEDPIGNTGCDGKVAILEFYIQEDSRDIVCCEGAVGLRYGGVLVLR